LLEAAWFDPTFVRRTARAHGLNTDSSYRFERGVDHGSRLTAAAARAAELIAELSGAECVGGHEALGQRPAVPSILLRPKRSEMLLGMTIEPAEAKRILGGLSVKVDVTDTDRWVCSPPTHRPDLEREVDLIEELMRHHGLEELPMQPTLPTPSQFELSADDVAHERHRERDDRILRGLTEAGLHEHISMVFSSEESLEPFADQTPLCRAVRVANPMRIQAALMRTHMLPGLLDALSTNVARHANPVRLFEYGRIYAWPEQPLTMSGPTADVDARLPVERQRAAILISDGARPESHQLDGRAMAGILLRVLHRAGVEGEIRPCESDQPTMQPATQTVPWLHPGVQAMVHARTGESTVAVGRLGQIHPDLADRWRLPDEVEAFYGEVWVEALPPWEVVRYAALPRFPATSRDLSLEIPIDLPAARIVDALRQAEAEVPATGDDPPRLAAGDRGQGAVEVLEDYRGQGVPEGSRALLLRLHYRATHRSVTDDEVQGRHAEIVERACQALRDRAPSIRTR
jgi:phenylalanyl-tRNA synthetase beta chain